LIHSKHGGLITVKVGWKTFDDIMVLSCLEYDRKVGQLFSTVAEGRNLLQRVFSKTEWQAFDEKGHCVCVILDVMHFSRGE